MIDETAAQKTVPIPDGLRELAEMLDFLGADGSIVRDLWATICDIYGTEVPRLLAMAIPATSGARDELEYYNTTWQPESRDPMSETEQQLVREFNVRPAYDCISVQPCVHGSKECKPGSGSSHGRHNAELHMTVRGPDAEVSLAVSTGWDLPTVPEYQRIARDRHYPRGAFVEIHTAGPVYEGQDSRPPRPDGSCRDWTACHLNTGYSMSDTPTRLLVEQGSDAVWEWLESLYATTRDEMAAHMEEAG